MFNSEIVWSDKASSDLQRLHAFLLEKNVDAAVNASEGIASATRLKHMLHNNLHRIAASERVSLEAVSQLHFGG